MRVLQAMAGAEVGGAEAFFVRLARALSRAGVDQRIVIRRHAARARLLAEAGLAPVELAFGGRLDVVTRRRLGAEIDAFRPDVVLSWMNRATGFCARARGRRAFAHLARLGGYYKAKHYRGCDHLIANTPEIAAYLKAAGWPAERVHFLPNFVDAEPAPAVPRESLDTPPDAPLLLALGRLHRNKAFDVLIEALVAVPDAWLWLAGEGPEGPALRDMARRTGTEPRIRFLGWRDDAASLLAAADALVCPSRIEPLGNVIIEAWAQRRPVVAAASAGPGWLIEPEASGLLAPVDDAGALAAAIRRVLGDRALAARLAAGGLSAWRDRFTEAAVVDGYMALFDEVAG